MLTDELILNSSGLLLSLWVGGWGGALTDKVMFNSFRLMLLWQGGGRGGIDR